LNVKYRIKIDTERYPNPYNGSQLAQLPISQILYLT